MVYKLIAISILSLSLFLNIHSTVSAEEMSQDPTMPPTTTITPSTTIRPEKTVKANEKDREEAKRISDNMKEEIKKRQELAIEERKAQNEELKQKREEAQEKFKEQRDAFKEKLQTIKDEKKQKIVENVDEKINSFNEQHTDRLLKAVDTLTEILNRVAEKAEKAKADVKDTTQAQAAIDKATELLTSAREAIMTQVGKEYVIEVTDETTLRTVVKKTFDEFKADISTLHMKVKAAHEAVRTAAQETAKLNKEGEASPEAKIGAEEKVNKVFKQ